MKVLLVGATGFVGEHIARKILSETPAHTVTLFVRNREKLDKVLGDASLLRKANVRPSRDIN